jgi:hypothetical protein
MTHGKIQILEAQIRECFGRVVYSHKTHEKCCDILLERLRKIKLAQIILSALSAGGFISVVFGGGIVAGLLGALVSTSLLVLNAYTKDYDLGELGQKHKEAANDLWIIRERYLSLLTDLSIGDTSSEKICETRDQLMSELSGIYKSAPPTTSDAYTRAQKALKISEDYTFSDTEIDAFLPNELKRANKTMEDNDLGCA